MKHLKDYQTLYEWSDTLFSYTFPLKLAGGHYGRRMIVCREKRRLLLISPLPPPPELAEALGRLGEIDAIVLPTHFHDTKLEQLQEQFADTPLYACPALAEKIPDAFPIDDLEEPWTRTLSWQRLEGMPKIDETVFYHPEQRTLLPSDLLFKFTPTFSRWTLVLARLMGTYPSLEPTRVFMSLVKDRAAFNASLKRILSWDFQRILPSHAEVIEGSEGREALERICRA